MKTRIKEIISQTSMWCVKQDAIEALISLNGVCESAIKMIGKARDSVMSVNFISDSATRDSVAPCAGSVCGTASCRT
jgi:hypothetical protein